MYKTAYSDSHLSYSERWYSGVNIQESMKKGLEWHVIDVFWHVKDVSNGFPDLKKPRNRLPLNF